MLCLLKILLTLILFFPTIANASNVDISTSAYTNQFIQGRVILPKEISTNLNLKGDKYTLTDSTTIITPTGLLSFQESQLLIKNSTIENKGNSSIIFKKSNLTGDKSKIFSTVILEDSILTFLSGHIDNLSIQGTADVAIKNTTFKTLEFRNLGVTPPKTGIGVDKIEAEVINIDLTNIKNDVKRNINIKNAKVSESMNIMGFINIENKDESPKPSPPQKGEANKLETFFNIEESDIKKVEYINKPGQDKPFIKLPNKSLGVVNFINTKIDSILVSYNLLRGLTFNGAYINKFSIEEDSYVEPNPSSNNKLPTDIKEDDNKPTPPKPPSFTNLQLMGTGTTYINTLDFKYAKNSKPSEFVEKKEYKFNIEGEISNSYNAPLSSIYIYEMKNYKDVQFSLYHLKDVYFGSGISEATKSNNKEKEDPNPIPGGDRSKPININYLHRVSTLGIRDYTVKFTWDLDKNKETKKDDQYLSIYNLSHLNMINSVIDVTKTNNLREDPKKEDPTKFHTPYDLNFTYAGSMSAFGTIFYFENTGAAIESDPSKFVDLRIRVQGNSFVTAKDMRSNLIMQLNGERNLFTLESNEYEKSYTFHTNYDYCYLDPVDGKQRPGCKNLQYNYWEYNESIRAEQNWYTFKADMVIVDKGSPEYVDYKNKNNKGKDYATTWFTYWQPYKVDENGKPAKDGKHGDKNAWEQKTDGSGRGGFPVEFGNKIEVVNSKVTFLKPLDNLTVLEVVGKGVVNFADLDTKFLEPRPTKEVVLDKPNIPQWITILRMRGGVLQMAKLPMVVDKLQVYNYGKINEATFRPVLGGNDKVKTNGATIATNKLIVNKEANFNNNNLLIDLYYDEYFTGLGHSVTLNILELGDYIHKEKVKENGKEVEKTSIKHAVLKNLNDINFNQGIMFDTKYNWKDEIWIDKDGKERKKQQLYVEITRVKDFGYFTTPGNKSISNILDKILSKYSTKVDKNNHIQFLDEKELPTLTKDTIKVINTLFTAKSKEELNNFFISLRPMNNEFVFNTIINSSDTLIDTIKNTNNYSYDNGRVALWVNKGMGSTGFSNNQYSLGGNINTQTMVAGGHVNFSKLKIGSFIGYANSKFNSAYFSGSAPQYGGGLYGDLNFKNSYFIKLTGLGTGTTFKGTRDQYFLADQADFNFNSSSIDSAISMGKVFNLDEGFFTSYVKANLGYVKVGGYKENGGSASLKVEEFNSAYYAFSLGIEYAKQIELVNETSLIPKVGISYRYRYYNLPDTSASFNKINGIEDSLNRINYFSNSYNKNSIYVNSGLSLLLGSKSNLSGSFSAEVINKDITNYTVFLGYKISL